MIKDSTAQRLATSEDNFRFLAAPGAQAQNFTAPVHMIRVPRQHNNLAGRHSLRPKIAPLVAGQTLPPGHLNFTEGDRRHGAQHHTEFPSR
jgi:hypothetical protein